MKIPNDFVSAAIWLVLGGTIAATSLRYGLGTADSPGTGFMPFLAGVAMVFFALIGLVHGVVKSREGISWKPVLRGFAWNKAVIVLAALLIYTLLLKRLGFFFCTALFIGFLFRVVKAQSWATVILGALAVAAGAYAIFEMWLQAQLPKGPWGW